MNSLGKILGIGLLTISLLASSTKSFIENFSYKTNFLGWDIYYVEKNSGNYMKTTCKLIDGSVQINEYFDIENKVDINPAKDCPNINQARIEIFLENGRKEVDFISYFYRQALEDVRIKATADKLSEFLGEK